MHLAEHDEFTVKFGLFISFPSNPETKKRIVPMVEGLCRPLIMSHTTFTHNGKRGWALFPKDDEWPALHSEVKSYILEQLNEILSHEIEYGPDHDRTIERRFYEGVEFKQNVEVNCFYFYDNPKWYR